jgi:hypothetical protein
MRGALHGEAKHPVRCHRIAIEWHLETRLMQSEKKSQSLATRKRNHHYIVRWGWSAKRHEVKVGPGTKNARNALLNVAPISLACESIGVGS